MAEKGYTMPAPKSLLKGFARTVAFAKPDPSKRVTLFDPDTRGLCVRITPKGRKTYTIVTRGLTGKQVWREVGDAGQLTLEEARELAREGVRRIKAGQEAFPKVEPPVAPDSFESVTKNFTKRHVQKQGLRSAPEIERIFNVYVLPEWKDRPFVSIRRGDVARLLDRVEDDNGPVMADHVLAAVSKLCNWYATRDDDYSTPIVRGMRRSSPKERARKRILTHDEIRLIWPKLDEAGRFGAFVKVLLLTGQRRTKVAEMKWSDIAEDGTWEIPTDAREKNNPGALRLPEVVMAIIRTQAPVKSNPHVFPGRRGNGSMAGFSPFKRALDADVAEALRNHGREPLENWVLHDLRRTARSLLSEAGVRPEHYPMVGEALLETFAEYLGDRWTPELKSAWAEAYGALAAGMSA